MKVTVTTLSDHIFVLDVSEDLELENFKAFCEVEAGIPAQDIVISFNGRPLNDNKKALKEFGIKDGDVVILQQMLSRSSTVPFSLDFSSIQVPSSSSSSSRSSGLGIYEDADKIRNMLLSNPGEVAILKEHNPRLANAFLTGTPEDFKNVLVEQNAQRRKRLEQRQKMLTADPFDTEAQRLIAEEIRQQNIEANMEAAMEHNPETFGTVLMLYINCRVNGIPIKAFIDSGAQTTIMSAACAERCNIMRLVDPRFSGIAKGVGVQKIIGRIHMVQLQIGGDFLTTSFSVLANQRTDMLLGLDMLKCHQCAIDLKRNVLRIGTTGSEAPFLTESELPESDRLTGFSNDEPFDDSELQEALAESSKLLPSTTSNVSPGASRPTLPRDPSIEILASDPFSETDVRELLNLGFTREQVIAELRRFNGDKTQATAALFAKSLKF